MTDTILAGTAGGALFVAFVCGGLLAFGRSRRAEQSERRSRASIWATQLALWGAPSVLVALVFLFGLRSHVDAAVWPVDALEVVLAPEGDQWKVDYGDGVVVSDAIRIPSERPVHLTLRSDMGPIRLAAPALALRLEARPQREGHRWLVVDSPGEASLWGTPSAGPKLVALAGVDFDRWRLEADGASLPPAEYGRKLYVRSQCQTCHSLDGSVITGPSFAGLFGRKEPLADGSEVTVDAAYLTESILDSSAKVVRGFQPVMPPFRGQLNDKQVAALVAFIEAQKQ